jgi:hypothetical protein
MFSGQTVWRGIIYAILMAIGKMITGLWLVSFSSNPVSGLVSIIKKPFGYVRSSCVRPQTSERSKKEKTPSRAKPKGGDTGNTRDDFNKNESTYTPTTRSQLSLPPKPKSLYPPSILGLAMVARGEVGYLIASIAESQGIFSNGSSDGPSEIYLVVIWAISLCTLIGPIMVGALVKRVKKLQVSRGSQGSDPLGVWGI